MERVFQVFISSPDAELADECRLVASTLAKAGFLATGPELALSDDPQQLDFIKRVIERSDYYVLVFGPSHRAVVDESLPAREREHEFAVTRKIPVLSFLHTQSGKPDAGRTFQEADIARRLRRFHDRAQQGPIVEYWNNKVDLCAKVAIGVSQVANLYPGIGWTRGDKIADANLSRDLERLRRENDDLRDRLESIDRNDAIAFPKDIAGPDRAIELTVESREFDAPRNRRAATSVSIRVYLGELFLELYEEILKGARDEWLSASIGAIVAKVAPLRDDAFHSVPIEEVTNLRYHYEGLGLIVAVGVPPSRDVDGYIAWEITKKGRRYAAISRAIEKAQPATEFRHPHPRMQRTR